jgi:hypothetical protein
VVVLTRWSYSGVLSFVVVLKTPFPKALIFKENKQEKRKKLNRKKHFNMCTLVPM